MKRKMLLFLCAFISVICCVFFVACGENAGMGGTDNGGGNTEQGGNTQKPDGGQGDGENNGDGATEDHKHNLIPVAANEATCTEDGNTAYYTCSGCEKWFSDESGKNEIADKSSVVIAKKHKLTPVAANKATCTEDGNTAYYTCSGCEKWFSDESGKNEITDKSSVIIVKSHSTTLVPAKAATCIADGYNEYYACGGCEKWFSDESGKNEITDKGSIVITERADHIFVDKICSVCGASQMTVGLEYTDKGDYVEVSGIGTATDTVVLIADEYEGKPVTSIGAEAFLNCGSLTSIIIPDGVTDIGNCAFSGCKSLVNITVPSSLNKIGNDVFYDCDSLKYSGYSFGSYLGNEENPYLILVKTYLMASGCIIHESTKLINGSAFSGSTVTEISIPDSVIFIGDSAFRNCSVATSLKIGSKVKYIGNNAFSYCWRLKSITIPASVTNIGNSAFMGCTGIKTLRYSGTMAQWKLIKKGEQWNYNIGNYTVYCSDGWI